MKKKLLFCVLILLLSLSSGCEKKEFPGDSGTVSSPGNAQIKELELVTVFPDPWLDNAVMKFNRSRKDYRVTITALTQTNEPSDWKAAFDKFNTQVMSGDTPDIIYSSQTDTMDISSYIDKGIMAELNELIDSDPGFNREDYLPSAFTSLERDGELYELFPCFWIETIAAKTSDAGPEPGWTLDEFASFLDSKPDAKFIFDHQPKEEFIGRMVCNLFIDPVTMEVNFDRGEFMKILKISDRFPTSEMQSGIMDDYDNFLSGTENGDPLMKRFFGTQFAGAGVLSVRYYDYAVFGGEEYTFKGYPAKNKENGTYLLPVRFSLVESPENEGGWEFIKFLFNMTVSVSSGFPAYLPVKLSELDRLAAEAKRDNGTNYVFLNGSRYDLGPNTDEDNKKFMELIKSAYLIYPYDTEILNIISEETGAYASGQKTADAVAGIVENRIKLYTEEVF